MEAPLRVATVGHSTRTLDAFLELLRAQGVTCLVDVRVAPGSRRHPHFAREALARALEASGIRYLHIKDLGGWRRPRPDSPHIGWRSEGFRGYADHMETPAFGRALDEVIALAASETVALMCAEAAPWRCHRQLIADALVARGVEVMHLLGPDQVRRHALTSFARLEGTRVIYDRHLGTAAGRGTPRNPRPR
ncbi:MAG: DUF488 domain-containing protein [Armatimonadota bacterium]|nr:DUF488 domain-containing protein [Armatimonadota bacterium]MDR7450868.1 DUF488 domain-containing protein [Armatimonadota bacterium]MDR7465790.1 DUF488 domain-containing protein [Armatimonadota bacterium]MDR7493698.1 DUF488 domain-containing protein [Armatimonadota bacterium]MDR7499054.1 DUF488 domain-containing protein [Armatimonadota bacterium]